MSFKNVTLDSNVSEKTTKVINLPSSRSQTVAPCDICHCKAKRLFSLSQQGLLYFVCHKCYTEVHTNRSNHSNSLVDLSHLVPNLQRNVKWEVIGTENKKSTSRLNKRKRLRRFKTWILEKIF